MHGTSPPETWYCETDAAALSWIIAAARPAITGDRPLDYHIARLEDLRVGQSAFFSKTITEADIAHFVAFTGDVNPLHVDAEFAKRTFFGQRIAHGMLSASLFSTLMGMKLPGVGAIYRSQNLVFLRPVHIGDTVTARFEIIRIDPDAETITLRSWVENQRGETVIDGEACAGFLRAIDG